MAETKAQKKAKEVVDGFQNRVIGLEMVKASELTDHPQNWRIHPENQRGTLLSLMESIGIADAALAYTDEDGQRVLIDGHLRKDLSGDQEVPVLMTDLSDDEASAILASHDVITTMAQRDEEELAGLLEDVADVLPPDVLNAIDPDLGGFGEDEFPDEGGPTQTGKYPVVPQLDEGYDFVMIFCSRDSEFAWLQTVLDLPTKRDKDRVGLSHVLTVDEFKERWANRD